jgi:hypothetical protein
MSKEDDNLYKGKMNFQYFRSPEDQAYLEMMVEERKKLPKKPPTTVQAASTQAILDCHSQGIFGKSFEGPININAQVKDDKGGIFINERPLLVEDIILIEGMRRGAKNELGTSQKSSVTEEKKERAIDAFIYTPPADLTDTEVLKVFTEMNKITPLTEVPTVNQLSWLKKLLNIFGCKGKGEAARRYSYAELQKILGRNKE